MAKAIKPTIRFAADFDAYKRELKRAIGQTDKFDRKLRGAGKTNNFRSIGKAALGAAAGIGAISVAGTQLKKSVDETVELAKATRQLQRATGLSAEEASRLAAVLKVRGIGTDKLGRSFVTLARQIEAAKTGSGAAADNFRKLGVSQRDIQRGNVSRILAASADGFQKLGDGTSKAAIAQQLFGRSSRDLIPLLEGGGKALRDQLALAPQLSQAQIEQAFAATKAQRQINLAFMKIRTTIGVALLPYISKAAKFISEMFEGGNTKGGRFAARLKEIWNAIKPALADLAKLAKTVFEFLAANPKLVKMAAYLGAVGLAIKAIKFGGAISGMSSFLGAARTLGGKLISSLRGSGTRAGNAAMSAAANSAADSAAGGVMTGGGRGKKFEKGGKGIGRWVGRGLAAGIVAGLILFGPQLAKELSDFFARNLPNWLKTLLGIRGSSDPRSPYYGAQGIQFRSTTPGMKKLAATSAVTRSVSSPLARSAISVNSNSSPQQVQQRIVELEKSIATYENALAKVEDRSDAAGKKARDRFKERLADLRYELGNLERRQQGESAIEGILQRIADLRIQAARAAADELGTSLNQRDTERARLRSLAAAAEFQREQIRLSVEASTADTGYVSQRAELVAQRDMAAVDATDPRVRARFERERARAQRDVERAQAQGDLDARDSALSQLAQIEERYGEDRAKRLQAEIDELDRVEQERRDNAQRSLDELRLSEQERLDALKGEAIEAANTTAAVAGLTTGLQGATATILQFLKVALMAGRGDYTGPAQFSSPEAVQNFLRDLLGVNFSFDTGETPLFGRQPSGARRPTIPRRPRRSSRGRASGGFLSSVPGSLTLVGETGPEYVTADGLVLSGSRTQRMGRAGNVTLNVYPRTTANDPVELARALGWQLATR